MAERTGKPGPDPWTPTPEQLGKVTALARCGCTVEEIATEVEVSKATFNRARQAVPELESAVINGRNRRKIWLRSTQDRIASGGNAPMAIFLGKNELGQSDRQDLNIKADVNLRSLLDAAKAADE